MDKVKLFPDLILSSETFICKQGSLMMLTSISPNLPSTVSLSKLQFVTK